MQSKGQGLLGEIPQKMQYTMLQIRFWLFLGHERASATLVASQDHFCCLFVVVVVVVVVNFTILDKMVGNIKKFQ